MCCLPDGDDHDDVSIDDVSIDDVSIDDRSVVDRIPPHTKKSVQIKKSSSEASELFPMGGESIAYLPIPLHFLESRWTNPPDVLFHRCPPPQMCYLL